MAQLTELVLCSTKCRWGTEVGNTVGPPRVWCDLDNENEDPRDEGTECPHAPTIMAEARRRGGTCDCAAKVEALRAGLGTLEAPASVTAIRDQVLEAVIEMLKGADS